MHSQPASIYRYFHYETKVFPWSYLGNFDVFRSWLYHRLHLRAYTRTLLMRGLLRWSIPMWHGVVTTIFLRIYNPPTICSLLKWLSLVIERWIGGCYSWKISMTLEVWRSLWSHGCQPPWRHGCPPWYLTWLWRLGGRVPGSLLSLRLFGKVFTILSLLFSFSFLFWVLLVIRH